MLTYDDIVKGRPGSCTEGTVAFHENMKFLVRDPQTGDELRHFVLLLEYEMSNRSNTAGHCIYVGERVTGEGSRFFAGGINPFEDPNIEYDSIESLIEGNTNALRLYLFHRSPIGESTEVKVMVRPRRYLLIDPETDLNITLEHYSDEFLQDRHTNADLRDTRSQGLQRIFQQHFEKNAIPYMEPK